MKNGQAGRRLHEQKDVRMQKQDAGQVQNHI
jgi:hypothetical protein